MKFETQRISRRKSLGVDCSSAASFSSHHTRSSSAPNDGFATDVLKMPDRSTPCTYSHVGQLINEIAILELEILHLERYLLSLYRTAFDNYHANLPSVAKNCFVNDHVLTSSSSNGLLDKEEQSDFTHAKAEDLDSHGCGQSDSSSHPPPAESPASVCASVPKSSSSSKGMRKPCFRSLADLLGVSLDVPHEKPNWLSEEILRCIGAIYCKLASPVPPSHLIQSVSPSLSTSSSSTFSPHHPSDVWSPLCDNDTILTPYDLEGLKESRGPYSGMVEVLKIFVDDDRFNYAETMLQSFKSLIQRLERVDLGKLNHAEKLAFWINIHNALGMHAHLAYGEHRSHLKNGAHSAKASYNVGGCLVNIYVIQHDILGCQTHRPSQRLRTLFSPGARFRVSGSKHIYALDNPEPLVHFALCSGSCSDPAVRVYKAEGVQQELKLARTEFIQTSIRFCRGTKVILPKILNFFARDAELDLPNILEMVKDCLPEAQRKIIQTCLKGRIEKCVEWAPYISAFRYIIHRDLAQGRTRLC